MMKAVRCIYIYILEMKVELFGRRNGKKEVTRMWLTFQGVIRQGKGQFETKFSFFLFFFSCFFFLVFLFIFLISIF